MKSIKLNGKNIKLIYIIDVILLILLLIVFFYYNLLMKKQIKKLDGWLGGYRYCGQFDEDKRCYDISIYEINGKYYAELIRRHGLEPETRTLGYIKGDEKSIKIFFDDTLPGDRLYEGDRYKRNELLVEMSYVDTELQTSWYAFRQEYPILCEREEGIAGVYFKRAE